MPATRSGGLCGHVRPTWGDLGRDLQFKAGDWRRGGGHLKDSGGTGGSGGHGRQWEEQLEAVGGHGGQWGDKGVSGGTWGRWEGTLGGQSGGRRLPQWEAKDTWSPK